uniref:Uncharacterized protein n=1 Tax=Zea mays TaxID=4577 RepID=C4J855_MAIZE|nr:unknown [Zea mays]
MSGKSAASPGSSCSRSQHGPGAAGP